MNNFSASRHILIILLLWHLLVTPFQTPLDLTQLIFKKLQIFFEKISNFFHHYSPFLFEPGRSHCTHITEVNMINSIMIV